RRVLFRSGAERRAMGNEILPQRPWRRTAAFRLYEKHSFRAGRVVRQFAVNQRIGLERYGAEWYQRRRRRYVPGERGELFELLAYRRAERRLQRILRPRRRQHPGNGTCRRVFVRRSR